MLVLPFQDQCLKEAGARLQSEFATIVEILAQARHSTWKKILKL